MKKTPWYPAKVKPVHNGVYKTQCRQYGCNTYHTWHDGQWYASASLMVPVAPLPWRGVEK